MLEYFAIAISLFFAMNIGASGAAASMGVAYGAGAIKKLGKPYYCAQLVSIAVLY